MAYVTAIGSNPEQVEYRLGLGHGCVTVEASGIQFSYHTDNRERPLIWTGAGLVEVGIVPGSELHEEDFDQARALMAGQDPRNGDQLVKAKVAVYEDAKVALAPLIRAVQARAQEEGVAPAELFSSSKKMTAIYERAARSVVNDGEGAALRADVAGSIADAAKVAIAAVWGEAAYSEAVANLTETTIVTDEDGATAEVTGPRRRVVGNMGYDISFTLPKSESLLLAFADEETAARVERIYTEQVGTTFDWLESQTAYGMRGEHGNGKSAETVPTSGFLGWSMVHRAARPVGEALIGDPHWHVHVTIANMARGDDGNWSTVAAGGRDLMRHIPAADHVLKALIRHVLTEELGVQFRRSERTGAWEVAAISDETLRAFSKRGASIEAMLTDLGFDPKTATRAAEDLAAAQTRHGKTHTTAAPDTTLRQLWQDEARSLGINPDQLAAQALPLATRTHGTGAGAQMSTGTGPAAGPSMSTPEQHGAQPADAPTAQQLEQDRFAGILTQLLDPKKGLTSSMRRFTRVDAIAAVADAMPDGAANVQEIEDLTDRILRQAGFVKLPSPRGSDPTANVSLLADTSNGATNQLGAQHMRNAERWSTADIVAAEKVILRTARASRPGQGMVAVSSETAALAQAAAEPGLGFALSGEQASAVHRLVTSDRALDAVIGPPGTGKSTMMWAARIAWESEGYVVVGAATAAVATQNLQTESGIPARTVEQWLTRIEDHQAGLSGPARRGGLDGIDVLVLDEANLTDDRSRAALYTEAARTGTKLVEVGDPKQLRGVGCGSLFGRVHKLVNGPALSINRRQKDEDDRAAIAAWREGRYAESLTSWSDRGRLIATETGEQAVTKMVATWLDQRSGAPDPHTELRGLVMLAATNELVERLNDAAQAVRATLGETGPEHSYAVRAGRTVNLREGDHIMIRLNDRQQRMHEGPDVLNGYRGVVESIEADGNVRVAWRQDTPTGDKEQTATLTPQFIAAGGVSLGYALTGHKSEGLTIKETWADQDGTRRGGTALVLAAGMDEPGMHVATSRPIHDVFIFNGLDLVESRLTAEERGTPTTEQEIAQRSVTALAEHARTHSSTANDRPVTDDLAKANREGDEATVQGRAQAPEPVAGEQPARARSMTTSPDQPAEEGAMSRHTWTTEPTNGPAERWHVGWEPALQTYFAQVEPAPGAQETAAHIRSGTGLSGGWPEAGTVWIGTDADSGLSPRILIDQIEPDGLVAVNFLDEEAGQDAAFISADEFGTRYTLIPPGDPRLDDLAGDDRLITALSPEAQAHDGIQGARPDEGTIWIGTDDEGLTQRIRVDEIEPESGLIAVAVLDEAEDEGALINPQEFGTRYTLVPENQVSTDENSDQLIDVIPGETFREVPTVRELETRLDGRVQIPPEVLTQLAAAEPSPLQAATAGHDPDDLSRRWLALREAGPSPTLPAESAGSNSESQTTEEEIREHEETQRPEHGRGSRL